MIGETVSHYRVLEKVGGGGMGVVYKAQDLKLDRLVAIKFLPAVTADEDDSSRVWRRERFEQEAKAASALDHPNVGTIFEIDETDDGQTFIVMAYYEGQTLSKKIENGPVPLDEVIDIGRQLATGLAKAHEKGIVHRDIKPANIIVTKDGVVKIIDFGLAKLEDVTRITAKGSLVGTVAYMAPEQVRGDAIDVRADVWALGVVLYEMLTGRRPFGGEHAGAVTHSILNSDPDHAQSQRKDLPIGVSELVARMLSKDPRQRPEVSAVAEALDGGVQRPERAAGSRKLTVAAIAVLAVLAAGMGWLYQQSARVSRARAAIQEVQRLADEQDYPAAFALAEGVEAVLPGDETLAEMWPLVSNVVSVRTTPPGADVYVKEYASDETGWRLVGASPVEELRVPIGLKKWRVQKAGFLTEYRLGPVSAAEVLEIDLSEEGSLPEEMVRIPGRETRAWLAGVDPLSRIILGEFLMDRYEVTNREYKAFVDAGGYGEASYWKSGFDLAETFVDQTGRPGPSTWQISDYPEGEGDHPVTGVSWYEAAAYAEFVGKSLPTVYHWVTASGTEQTGAAITAASRYAAEGTAAVGSGEGMNPYGTYDMAGNVREWCWNRAEGSDERYILGGSWRDPAYTFGFAQTQSPRDRSNRNGIRLVRYIDDSTLEGTRRDIELTTRDYRSETPVSDDVFEVYKQRFAYDDIPLNDTVEAVDDSAPHWTSERVTLDAAYGGERLILDLLTPKNFAPPFQTVLFYPGSTAIWRDALPVGPRIDFILKSGRAVALPHYRGTFERRSGLLSTWPDMTRGYVDYVTMWVQDLQRTIDYLETREDVDTDRLAYLGFSWGGRMGAIIPAVEDRLKVSILLAGGLASGRARPEVDQLNFVTRVTIPTLMLNGRLDSIEPVETAQLPLLEMLGTPPEHKRHVLYETGHSMPVNSMIRETLDWLDRYLGPVE